MEVAPRGCGRGAQVTTPIRRETNVKAGQHSQTPLLLEWLYAAIAFFVPPDALDTSESVSVRAFNKSSVHSIVGMALVLSVNFFSGNLLTSFIVVSDVRIPCLVLTGIISPALIMSLILFRCKGADRWWRTVLIQAVIAILVIEVLGVARLIGGAAVAPAATVLAIAVSLAWRVNADPWLSWSWTVFIVCLQLVIIFWNLVEPWPVHMDEPWLACGIFAMCLMTTVFMVQFEAVGRAANKQAWMVAQTMLDERNSALEVASLDRQRAEKALQSQGMFVAKVSHELRTPLNGILGMLELVQNSSTSAVDAQEFVHSAYVSSQHLLSIVTDLLEFSALSNNGKQLKQQAFRLSDCVSMVQKLMAPLAARKAVNFNVQIMPGTPDSFLGDGDALRQILINIAGNSVKFTDSGKVSILCEQVRRQSVSISTDSQTNAASGVVPSHDMRDQNSVSFNSGTSPVSTTLGGRQATLQFRVEDTGPGIDDANLTKLFQPFSKGADHFGGTGLGLVIAKGLVSLMNGDIHVESTVGKGSVFTITVQLVVDSNMLSESSNIRSEPSPSVPSTDGPFNILLVEQSPSISPSDPPAESSFLFDPSVSSLLTEKTFPKLEISNSPRPVKKRVSVTSIPGIRALVVDDVKINVKVCQRMLMNAGYEVDVAYNGKEAVDAVRKAWEEKRPFGVVLMDVNMPVLGGLQATQIIRADDSAWRQAQTTVERISGLRNSVDSDEAKTNGSTETSDFLSAMASLRRRRITPIIMVTAAAMQSEIAEYSACGANYVLSKPYSQLELLAAVRQCVLSLDQQVEADPKILTSM
eukprot:gb/GEZN01002206.1/.p1 GENE.gb/GEZN01002206.1/~~gb/GEZN01002206.1/.p1  ORF type:complete len:810 (-),score=83.87 gb/GEZN01002206.1/:157-2586(-)